MISRIDAHHHFWRFDAAEYAWIGAGQRVLRKDFLPEDFEPELRAAGITGTIAVQARQSLEESRWLLELADQHEFIHGVVGWAPLTEANVGATLERLTTHPKLRAIRHVLHDEADERYILREDFNRGVAELKSFDLAYDILIFERHLPQTIEFVDRHPNQIFIVDHLAKPRVRDGVLSPWRENMRELARRPHVYCKISGLTTEADHSSWSEMQLAPYMDWILSLFGPERAMFGSDWPVCLLAVGYREWIEIVARFIGRLSEGEQQRIWSATAREAYKLRGNPH
jgi:L-fuconolactonase